MWGFSPARLREAQRNHPEYFDRNVGLLILWCALIIATCIGVARLMSSEHSDLRILLKKHDRSHDAPDPEPLPARPDLDRV